MYAAQRLVNKRIDAAKRKFDGSEKSRTKKAEYKKLLFYAKLAQKNTGKG